MDQRRHVNDPPHREYDIQKCRRGYHDVVMWRREHGPEWQTVARCTSHEAAVAASRLLMLGEPQ